jgi:hypothetical protein
LIHPEKLDPVVRELVELDRSTVASLANCDERPWTERREQAIPVRRRFGQFYMTMLASRIAGAHGLGLLADSLQNDSVVSTPVSKLVRFRNTHAAELGRLRNEIERLTKEIDPELPRVALQQAIHDAYTNAVLPALDSLHRAITGSGIKYVTESFLKTSLLSAPSTSLAYLATNSLPLAISVGGAVALAQYSLERQQQLRNSPYTFVLNAEKTFNTVPS